MHATDSYSAIMAHVFSKQYVDDATEVQFSRQDLIDACNELGQPIPKNIGDVVYAFRYRRSLPDSIISTAPDGKEWVINGRGRAKYAFELDTSRLIEPTVGHAVVKIPDATPELVAQNTLGDEQALLARVRYNRLVDVFLGVTAYSLQNHLRTTVENIGQVEVDELYAAVDRHGAQYIIPVQAKGGSDQIGIVQVRQDFRLCSQKFGALIARPIAAHFLPLRNTIVLFELALQDEDIVIVQEQHYRLVPADDISNEDRAFYRSLASR